MDTTCHIHCYGNMRSNLNWSVAVEGASQTDERLAAGIGLLSVQSAPAYACTVGCTLLTLGKHVLFIGEGVLAGFEFDA